MRSLLPLGVVILALAAVSYDLWRRVAGTRASSGANEPTASLLRRLRAGHESTFVLEAFDGTVSTLEAVVTATTSTPLGVVFFDVVRLDSKLPLEPVPMRWELDPPASECRVRFRFRDVVWERDETTGAYSAYLERRLRVLYSGCDPVDAVASSAAAPLRVASGRGFDDLERRRERR